MLVLLQQVINVLILFYPLFNGKFEDFKIYIEIGDLGKIYIFQQNIYPRNIY